MAKERIGVAKSIPLCDEIMSGEYLILVDEQDHEYGVEEKLQAHVEGVLHRAFSIFVFDSEKRLLLQKRAQSKYHSGGLWSNTVCGHPRPGETTLAAARRRLREEMGFDCELHRAFSFQYRVELENRLIEHEYDHVFVGDFNGDPMPNILEVESWCWISMSQLRQAVRDEPDKYSYWLRVALDREEWHDAFA